MDKGDKVISLVKIFVGFLIIVNLLIALGNCLGRFAPMQNLQGETISQLSYCYSCFLIMAFEDFVMFMVAIIIIFLIGSIPKKS